MVQKSLKIEIAKDILSNKSSHESIWSKQGRVTFTDKDIRLGEGASYIVFSPLDVSTLVGSILNLESRVFGNITAPIDIPAGTLQISNGDYLMDSSGSYILTTEG